MAAIDDATGKLVTFICSPTQFVETAAAGPLSLGYEPARIKTERFGPIGGA
jgi:ferredoxin-NADP reductase